MTVAQGWTPDVIIGRAERKISCSMRALYRQFKKGIFNQTTLPMKGKRKPNSHKEKCGKQTFKRKLSERLNDYPILKEELDHPEGDAIIGVHYKRVVIKTIWLFTLRIQEYPLKEL